MWSWFNLLLMAFFTFLVVFTLSGCSTFSKDIPRITPDKTVEYRWDLLFEINGKKHRGVATPKSAKRYEIKVYNRDIDIMRYTGCSRQGIAEKQDKVSLIKDVGSKFYSPIRPHCGSSHCILVCPLCCTSYGQT